MNKPLLNLLKSVPPDFGSVSNRKEIADTIISIPRSALGCLEIHLVNPGSTSAIDLLIGYGHEEVERHLSDFDRLGWTHIHAFGQKWLSSPALQDLAEQIWLTFDWEDGRLRTNPWMYTVFNPRLKMSVDLKIAALKNSLDEVNEDHLAAAFDILKNCHETSGLFASSGHNPRFPGGLRMIIGQIGSGQLDTFIEGICPEDGLTTKKLEGLQNIVDHYNLVLDIDDQWVRSNGVECWLPVNGNGARCQEFLRWYSKKWEHQMQLPEVLRRWLKGISGQEIDGGFTWINHFKLQFDPAGMIAVKAYCFAREY